MSELLPALVTGDPVEPGYQQLALDWDGVERRQEPVPAVLLPDPASAPVDPPPPPPVAAATAAAELPLGRRRLRAQERAFQRRRRRRNALVTLLVLTLLAAAVAAGGLALRHRSRPSPVAAPATAPLAQTLLLALGAPGAGLQSAILYGLTPAAGSTAAHGGALLLPPRTLVTGPGETLAGTFAADGSGTAVAAAVGDLVGVRVDASWRLTPEGLTALVSALGGVAVDVDAAVASGGLSLAAGQQVLSGPAATTYALYQGDDTVQAQANRTRLVLDGVLAKVAARGAALPALLGALGASSTSSWPTARLASYLRSLAVSGVGGDAQQLPVTSLDTGAAQPALAVDRSATPAVVAGLFGNAVRVDQGAAGTRVEVVNDGGRPGLAASARSRLVAAGLTYVLGVNDQPFHQYPRTSVLVFDASAASIARGHRVAAALGLPSAPVLVSGQLSSVADAEAVLDDDYH